MSTNLFKFGVPRNVSPSLPQGHTVKSKAMAAHLVEATEALRLLQLNYGPRYLASLEGTPEAIEALALLQRQINAAKERVEGLTASVATALDLEAKAVLIAKENAFHAGAKEVRDQFKTLLKAASDIEAAEASRARAWKAGLNACIAAQKASPQGFPMTWSDWLSVTRLAELVRHETWRQGGIGMSSGSPDPKSLPGYVIAPGHVNSPDRVSPLTVEVKGYITYLDRKLNEYGDSLAVAT